METTLIIDSRSRSSGDSASNFVLNLVPAIHNVGVVKLSFASLPVGVGSDQLYWCCTIPELGISARGANAGASSCTFTIPVLSGEGYRTLFNSNTSYEPIANGGGATLTQLSVRLHYPDGSAVDTGAEDVLLMLSME
jgi:hypothetical protein